VAGIRISSSLVQTETQSIQAEVVTNSTIAYILADQSQKIVSFKDNIAVNKNLVQPFVMNIPNIQNIGKLIVHPVSGMIIVSVHLVNNAQELALENYLNISLNITTSNYVYGAEVVLCFDTNSTIINYYVLCTDCKIADMAFSRTYDFVSPYNILITGTKYGASNTSQAFFASISNSFVGNLYFTLLNEVTMGNSEGMALTPNSGGCWQGDVIFDCTSITGVTGFKLDNNSMITVPGYAFIAILTNSGSLLDIKYIYQPSTGLHSVGTSIATSATSLIVAVTETDLATKVQTVKIFSSFFYNCKHNSEPKHSIIIYIIVGTASLVVIATIVTCIIYKKKRNAAVVYSRLYI